MFAVTPLMLQSSLAMVSVIFLASSTESSLIRSCFINALLRCLEAFERRNYLQDIVLIMLRNGSAVVDGNRGVNVHWRRLSYFNDKVKIQKSTMLKIGLLKL